MKRQKVDASVVSHAGRRAAGLVVAAIAAALSNAPSRAQSPIDPDADPVLRAMTDQLQTLKEFDVELAVGTDATPASSHLRAAFFAVSGSMLGGAALVVRQLPWCSVGKFTGSASPSAPWHLGPPQVRFFLTWLLIPNLRY